ncbi:phosphotyrosine protein phosphatase [Streptomyces sparsogenes]|uniref:phosphotyrosine protein phosphatase n=1 Tax=Streptomyces sparsogenes TaxID=67365 RepID=UPI0033E12646
MTASPSPVLPDERLAAGAARLAAQHTGHFSAETVRHLRPGRRGRTGSGTGAERAGVSLEDAFPEPLTGEVVQAADIVVTMGCGDACPVVPGRRYLDWPVADPDGAPITAVRAIRDEIDTTSPTCPPPSRTPEPRPCARTTC